MARPTSTAQSRPGRTLGVLALVVVALLAAMFFTHRFSARLGLDLQGGTSITLTPVAAPGGKVTDAAMNQAIDIIRNRVNAQGVAESEVARQGSGSGQTIVISVPGATGRDVLESVGSTAQLRFRQVWAAGAPVNVPATPAPTGSAVPAPSGSATPSPSSSASPSASPKGRAVPKALATPTPTASSTASSSASPAPSAAATGSTGAQVKWPTQPQSFSGTTVTPALTDLYDSVDCSNQTQVVGFADKPALPLVTCSTDGQTKYILGPARVEGTEIASASAGFDSQQGKGWMVQLRFKSTGAKQWAQLTTEASQAYTANPNDPRGQIGIALDSQVVSAPQVSNGPITTGDTQITGSFTEAKARLLANQLKYGALPLSFKPSNVQQISPTLGADQLHAGLLAGLIGLILVVLYALLYYRGLALVSVLSLVVAGFITFATVVLLGKVMGFTLTLAGVAGLIVSIGITADSFIVYFERLRDEVREGRSLRVAVETGWARARRTILTADFVSFLAAAVLYFLAIGSVRGFAFTLGLTTLIDVLVVFMFTHPMLAVLARTKFFGSGNRLSGLDPERLGARRVSPAPPGSTRGARPAGVATKEA